jgi:hypothetical protein
MKEHIEKNKTKYTALVFVVFAVIIILLVLAGLKTFTSPDKTKGSVSVSFDDKDIKTGKSTFLTIGAKNDGKKLLSGEFKIKVDNPEYVKINYPDPTLLKFDLMPGESIERRINITGTSIAYRTYYKITVSIEEGNSTYAKNDAILIVRNE